MVLQRLSHFLFIKSKQQIIREKEGLKPNKNSVVLRKQIRKQSSNPTSTISRKETDDITKLRAEFECTESVTAFLQKLSSFTPPEQTRLLTQLQGKELTRILKAIGQPAFQGKKKAKQVTAIIETVHGGTSTVIFPEKVSTFTVVIDFVNIFL